MSKAGCEFWKFYIYVRDIQSGLLCSCNSIKILTSLPSLYTTILHSKYTDRLKELVTDGQG